jgi:response regulator RpfG family c-di-GMP phosphodiesterase
VILLKSRPAWNGIRWPRRDVRFEVARFVRALDPAYRPRIAIITAIYKDTRYQNEARLKYGVDHYLVKPVTRDQVASAVFGG